MTAEVSKAVIVHTPLQAPMECIFSGQDMNPAIGARGLGAD